VRDDGVLVFDSLEFHGERGASDVFTEIAAGSVVVLKLLTNSFHHVAMTTDGRRIALFVDGIPNGSAMFRDIRGPRYLGAWVPPGSSYSKDHLKGFMNEVRIWQRNLAPWEIAANRRTLPYSGNQLRAAYTLDRGQFYDRTGRSSPAWSWGEDPPGFDLCYSGLPWLPGPQ